MHTSWIGIDFVDAWGEWHDECPVHGNTEFGTAVNGCFKCASDRLKRIENSPTTATQ